jgi:hypothetical protein
MWRPDSRRALQHCRPTGSGPETGFGETTRDVLEEGLLRSNVENPQQSFESKPVQSLWVVVDTALPLCTLEQISFGQSVMLRTEI